MKQFFFLLLFSSIALGQASYDTVSAAIATEALEANHAIGMLKELALGIGHRISGSPQADQAVQWAKKTMEQLQFDNVRLEPVMVPRWVRGPIEEVTLTYAGTIKKLNACALGGSVGTPPEGITAEVVEVKSFQELASLGATAKGKIVFYNRAFERRFINTFQGYGRAVDQRWGGAIMAARSGGVAWMIRSMSSSLNDFPHTGSMGYADTLPKVPGIAISTNDAEFLGRVLKTEKNVRVTVKLACQTLSDVRSYNVLGELRGTEKPDEVIVIGGHLDSWDKGQGAHDDGSGCVQSIEALRILKSLGLKPKRTIRAVMFMNEENGLRGGRGYADTTRGKERHIAAVESDEGGFTPRGFGISDTAAYTKAKSWEPLFRAIGADRFFIGGGGADISPMGRKGVPMFGLNVDSHRYFDYHHTDADTFDKVNERELALGAACMAILSYLIAQEGL
ncbi:MAG: M20/M25/M40 family metallo-hydrolase [Ignavibacteriales bacterium]|nr:M20/M25/M40 family metallo-hydrolase [Ignavibacteriales bacterium]